jgi:hypothetical protein
MTVRYFTISTGRCNTCLTILRATDTDSLADVARRHDEVSHPELVSPPPGQAG